MAGYNWAQDTTLEKVNGQVYTWERMAPAVITPLDTIL